MTKSFFKRKAKSTMNAEDLESLRIRWDKENSDVGRRKGSGRGSGSREYRGG